MGDAASLCSALALCTTHLRLEQRDVADRLLHLAREVVLELLDLGGVVAVDAVDLGVVRRVRVRGELLKGSGGGFGGGG